MNPLNLPNIPTDNLYKFNSLSGIVLILFIFTTLTFSLFKIQDDIDDKKKSVAMVNVEVEYLTMKVNELRAFQSGLNKRLNTENLGYKRIDSIINLNQQPLNRIERINVMQFSPEYREFLQFFYDYNDFIFPENEISKEIVAMAEELELIENEIKLKLAKIDIENEILMRRIWEIVVLIVCGAVFISISLRMTFKGFRLWKENVQDPMDKKIKMEIELMEFELNKIRNETLNKEKN